MIKLVISGILGRMGQVLKSLAETSTDFSLVGGFDQKDSSDSVADLSQLKPSDVIIDFSHPSNLKQILMYAHEKKIPLVLAATGYSDIDFEWIRKTSKDIPIFYAANYSVGIHLLTKALKLVSESVDESFDIEMIDKHHKYKKDAPSGTAYKLYDAVNDGLKEKRELIDGASIKPGIHVHSLRLGNYVGEHKVIFSNLSETLELTHIAHDKNVFALGAMKAAKFIVTQKNGLYGMDDLLGEA
ncbi:MAG: 4-hydroxy-tetrahydrodipicolinate reductase [Acholeplasma sp.]